MKKKDIQSIAHLSKEELMKETNEFCEKLVALRLSRFTKQMKNTREMKNMRRKIAVLQTFLRQKEQAI